MTEPKVASKHQALFPMSAELTMPKPAVGSWMELARAEQRRYWSPHKLRLWIQAVVLLDGLIIVALILANADSVPRSTGELALSICLHSLTHLGMWGSAWIVSDLLSRDQTDNPDLGRSLHPRELLASFVGRLIPFYAGYFLWSFTFAGACGARAVDSGWLDALLTIDPSKSAEKSLVEWAGWSVVIWSGACGYGSISAFLSGFFRRPHRILVTLASMIAGTLLLLGIVLLLFTVGEFGDSSGVLKRIEVVGPYLTVNPLYVGLLWSTELMSELPNDGFLTEGALGVQFQAVLFYLIQTTVCMAGALWVASSRHRRTSYRRESGA